MSLKLVKEYPGNHIDCIWCVKFNPNPDLKMFASSGSDSTIIIWEYDNSLLNYKKTSILSKTHKSTIRSLDWDYTGKYLSAASFDNNISIWKITNNNSPYSFSCISLLESNDSEIKSVSWSVSGNFLACCSRKGNIWVWEKDEDDYNSEDFICKSTFEGHKGDVKMVKFSPREDILFTCGFDETIKIWDLDFSKDDFVLVNTLKNHGGTVWFIEFNKNGDKFFTCSDDKCVIMWGINLNEPDKGGLNYENIVKINEISNLHIRPIYCCVLSFDEKFIFTASNDGDIGIIRVNGDNMELLGKEKDSHDQYSVNCISVNKKENENEIISCGDDCSIKIWKFQENKN